MESWVVGLHFGKDSAVRLHKVRRGKVAKPVDAPVKVYKYIVANAIDSTSTVDGKIEVQGAGLAQDDVEHGGDDKALQPDDNFYCACIVLIPDAGVFYCHREQRTAFLSGIWNSHVPMDIDWLRLRCFSQSTVKNWFLDGSYVSRLMDGDCRVWKWSVRHSASNLLPYPGAIKVCWQIGA